jgi:hypothetical protein
MHPKSLFGFARAVSIALSWTACIAAARPAVVLVAENCATEKIENVRVQFGREKCSWGTIGKTFMASYDGFPHPITDEATFHWKLKGLELSQKIEIRLAYRKGKSGDLVFRVYDDRVEVKFIERK